uniref:Single-stranded DNA binding protein n=1 Tax=Galaxaura rugosa TaxID=268570 RepID=A0A1G4NST8_9FLOR|nr:Hypothetical protein ycf41 [Galaxaura rugosa]SCW21743.1 Hypothetical protein ycf41 [Galaxaura rugosa]
MNIYMFTVQLATWPRKFISKQGQYYVYCFVKVPNPKKGKGYYYLYSIAAEEIGENLMHLYNKGDYLIIEGKIQKSKITKKMQLNIMKDYPIILSA